MICTLIQIKTKDNNNTPVYYRVCTSSHDVVFQGDTYLAIGDIVNIDNNEATAELNKTGTTVTVGGIDPAFQAELDSGGFIRAPIDIIIADVPDNDNVVSTYSYYHRGYCDTPVTTLDFNSGTITMTIETANIFVNLDLKSTLLGSSISNHSSRHQGDKFFEYSANVDMEETCVLN